MEHVSVMLKEVLDALDPQDGKVYFDATFGGGGYSRAILERAKASVIACDRDLLVASFADEMKKEFTDRFQFFHAKFSDIKNILREANVEAIDGLVLDLGISNLQLQDNTRGFSFSSLSNLNMEMGLCGEGVMDVLHKTKEQDLADIIYKYGEEPKSRRIAKSIKYNLKGIKSSHDLAEVVFRAVGKKGKTHPATKTFQALRIFVNRELEELEEILNVAPMFLKDGGKIVVVSFHSLEDRIVKLRFRELAIENFSLLTKKPRIPSDKEIKNNPKARSAKLRALKKIS